MTEATRRQILKAIDMHSQIIRREERRPADTRPAAVTELLATYRAKVAELWTRLLNEPVDGEAGEFVCDGDGWRWEESWPAVVEHVGNGVYVVSREG